jgi:hypothetical protein
MAHIQNNSLSETIVRFLFSNFVFFILYALMPQYHDIGTIPQDYVCVGVWVPAHASDMQGSASPGRLTDSLLRKVQHMIDSGPVGSPRLSTTSLTTQENQGEELTSRFRQVSITASRNRRSATGEGSFLGYTVDFDC